MTTLTDTQVITASGGLVELGYSQITSNVSVASASTGTGATTVIAPVTVVCDGGPVLVEFFAANAAPSTTSGDFLAVSLMQDGAEAIRYWTYKNNNSGGATDDHLYLSRRLTPSAGSHTFGVNAFVTSAARPGKVNASASTSSDGPAFLRVSKIVQATQWPAVTTGTIICTSSTRPASPFEGQTIYETDTKRELRWNGTGWVSPSVAYAPPMASATITTTTAYTQDTDISWTSENYDNDAMFSPTSSSMTVKTAGVYLVTFVGRATSTTSAGYNAVIRLAGGNDPGEEIQVSSAATADARWSMSAVRKMAVNDTITARLQWSGTITLQGGTTISPTLTATWLGAA